MSFKRNCSEISSDISIRVLPQRMDATPEDVLTVLLLGAAASSTKVGSTTAGGSTDLTGTIDVCSSE